MITITQIFCGGGGGGRLKLKPNTLANIMQTRLEPAAGVATNLLQIKFVGCENKLSQVLYSPQLCKKSFTSFSLHFVLAKLPYYVKIFD